MKNILLVDDEMIFLKSLAEGLRMVNKDYNVMLAKNGEHAIRVLKSVRVDLLLTDLKMPVMDGFDLLVEVLKKYPYLPVIVTSAFSNDDVIKKINAMGFIHFLEKPFEFDDLTDKISLLLQERAKKSSKSSAAILNNSESRVQAI
jgi:DNA-binding NtrC family response regulator